MEKRNNIDEQVKTRLQQVTERIKPSEKIRESITDKISRRQKIRKKKIAILFGGCSPEYKVSLQSAYAIIKNMDRDKYAPVLLGITRDGEWYRYYGKPEKIRDDTWTEHPNQIVPAMFSPDKKDHGIIEFTTCNYMKDYSKTYIDAAFPVLHGKNGEDGTVQGVIELSGIPLIGCGILIDNSFCYYMEVSALSFSWAWLLAILKSWSRSRIGSLGSDQNIENRAWIELDKKALKNNIRFLQSLLPNGCCLMPVVKANAYGHGDVLVARECQKQGIHFFCVACVSEGVRLRRGGIKGEILILGYTSPCDFHLLYKYNLTQTIADFPYAENLEESGLKIHVHIGIDTGMHRLGIPWDDKQNIVKVLKMKHLIVDGMYTHLSSSDSLMEEAEIFTRKQVERFRKAKSYIRKEGFCCPKFHIQASYGLLNYPEYCEDYARVGIALYGFLSTREDTGRWKDKLSPVLSLKCYIASIREVKAGDTIGYGMDSKAPVTMRIAVLTMGYADGVPRALSNGVGAVLIAGVKVPVVGRICMDQMMVDVSDISEVHAGDEAVFIGKTERGDLEISACDWAEWTGSITNEVFSRLGERLGREVV